MQRQLSVNYSRTDLSYPRGASTFPEDFKAPPPPTLPKPALRRNSSSSDVVSSPQAHSPKDPPPSLGSRIVAPGSSASKGNDDSSAAKDNVAPSSSASEDKAPPPGPRRGLTRLSAAVNTVKLMNKAKTGQLSMAEAFAHTRALTRMIGVKGTEHQGLSTSTELDGSEFSFVRELFRLARLGKAAELRALLNELGSGHDALRGVLTGGTTLRLAEPRPRIAAAHTFVARRSA